MMRLILFFMASLMAFDGTSWAEDVLPCSVDTVPIQIFNQGLGPKETLSEVNGQTAPFLKNVTEHIAARLAQENLCLNSVESQERSLIQFFYSPRVLDSEEDFRILSLSKSLEASAASAGHLSSPWIDIVIEREPVPSVRAIVRFSERQLIADQAMLHGVPNVPTGVVMPVNRDEYLTYVSLYSNWEQRGKFDELWPEGKVPSDILWMLSGSGGYGGVLSTGRSSPEFFEAGVDGYTNIVLTLIDQCFNSASDGKDMHYNSILEVGDLISLEKYKIVEY